MKSKQLKNGKKTNIRRWDFLNEIGQNCDQIMEALKYIWFDNYNRIPETPSKCVVLAASDPLWRSLL